MDHRVGSDQFVVNTTVVLSDQELGRPGFVRTNCSSRGTRTWRSDASYGFRSNTSAPCPEEVGASTLVWGRTHSTATFRNLNSYLAESVLPISRKNFITGRFELVDKDELFSNDPILEEHLDSIYGSTFRIGAYTLGYTRDIDLFRNIETGVGANFTAYTLPDAIKPYYDARPVGANLFVRFRLRAHE